MEKYLPFLLEKIDIFAAKLWLFTIFSKSLEIPWGKLFFTGEPHSQWGQISTGEMQTLTPTICDFQFKLQPFCLIGASSRSVHN